MPRLHRSRTGGEKAARHHAGEEIGRASITLRSRSRDRLGETIDDPIRSVDAAKKYGRNPCTQLRPCESLAASVISTKEKGMRVKSAPIASLVVLALSFAVPVLAADKPDTHKTVTCKDGTTTKSGKGECAHHGGVQKGGASSSAHEKNEDKESDKPKSNDDTESHGKEHSGASAEHSGAQSGSSRIKH